MPRIVDTLFQASAPGNWIVSACDEGASRMTNDNDPETQDSTISMVDPSGQAALLLLESLIHGLCEKASLSTQEAIEIVQRAVDVQFDRAEAADIERIAMWQAHALLLSIVESLRIDSMVAPTPG